MSNVSRSVFVGVVFGLAVGVSALGASTGCSSSSAAATPTGPVSHACPATIQDTIGAACSVKGQVCGPTFTCGTTEVPITCTCIDGSFQCVDPTGATFDNSSTTSCGTSHPGGGTCPADETTANRAACTLAEVGQQCAYAPQCPGGTQAFDVCTCTSGATKNGGQGLVYICENSCSGGTGPVPDAGGPPPPDSGSPGDDGGSDDGSDGASE